MKISVKMQFVEGEFDTLTEHEDRKCKIVGNIFDNPKVLKGMRNKK